MFTLRNIIARGMGSRQRPPRARSIRPRRGTHVRRRSPHFAAVWAGASGHSAVACATQRHSAVTCGNSRVGHIPRWARRMVEIPRMDGIGGRIGAYPPPGCTTALARPEFTAPLRFTPTRAMGDRHPLRARKRRAGTVFATRATHYHARHGCPRAGRLCPRACARTRTRTRASNN